MIEASALMLVLRRLPLAAHAVLRLRSLLDVKKVKFTDASTPITSLSLLTRRNGMPMSQVQNPIGNWDGKLSMPLTPTVQRPAAMWRSVRSSTYGNRSETRRFYGKNIFQQCLS